MFTFASVKREFLSKIFTKNFSLDDSGIFLPPFPSRTNPKLHNISQTLKSVQKVITNLDLSRVSGLDCILVAVLKKFETELSCRLAELFNMYLKESCFPEVSSGFLVFKNVKKKSVAENYRSVSLLSVIRKVFEKLVANRTVDHLEKCSLISNF